MPKTSKPKVTEVTEAPKTSDAVSHNISMIVWPTDIYGVTKEFKTAVMRMASKARGDDKKREVIDETIRIALAHFEAKFIDDKKRLRTHLDKKEAKAKAAEPVRF